MMFKNRRDAGEKLARKLTTYKNSDVIVYALPRGGVEVGLAIAKYLGVPLDLIITRKIGHPQNPEYAIAAVCEDTEIVGSTDEINLIDQDWFKHEVEKERHEAARRRSVYVSGRKPFSCENKTAIIVDDGVATGYTMRVAVRVIQRMKPQKIVIAIPVVPQDTYKILKQEVDTVIALDVPKYFLGSVGAYYTEFPQVTDGEVVSIMKGKTT